MLQIKEVRKKYVTGDLVQTALDGVSLNLRDSEFVAILGPSGSGKTTLLNVIGGLDRYDSGDLVINGISTKQYTDRDWDSYRNHTIGFVFQSYNLIPHQTVLANVELALTISGVSRQERRRRAVKALEDVGLGSQLHKRPSQMSGGQMQRVAIARALVNDPDILLADEPTGALDSETSVQVMELLKEVSRDRLVVMVTHNPELAESYANRIVRVKDGRIISDSKPLEAPPEGAEPPRHQNMGKSSMSPLTALSLSFNNLKTKKARTLLTSFAGSIGIIGIALILSLSTGFQKYIDKIQEDTLSGYPLTIQSEAADMTSAMAAFGSVMSGGQEAPEGTVMERQMLGQMFAQVGSNDLGAFMDYLEAEGDRVSGAINAIQYGYGIQPRIYGESAGGKLQQMNPATLFSEITGSAAMSAYMDSNLFQPMLDNRAMLDSQYDVLQGRWPEEKDEVVIVLNGPGQISDYMAYTLGLKDMDVLNEMIEKVMSGQEAQSAGEPMTWSYEDLMSLRFYLVSVPELYRYNSEYNVWEDMSGDPQHLRQTVEKGMELRVVGIVCPKEGSSSTALQTGVAYLPELTDYVIETAAASDIVRSQLAREDVDVFTGQPFGAEEKNGISFENMISVDEEALASAFGMGVSQEEVIAMVESYLERAAGSVSVDTAPAQEDFTKVLASMGTEMLEEYLSANADPETGAARLYLTQAEAMADSYLAGASAQAQMERLAKQYSVPKDTFAQVFKPLLSGMVTVYIGERLAEDVEDAVPEVTVPDVTIPEITIPEVTIPEVTIPEVTIPDVTIPDVTIPDVTIPDVTIPDVTIPDVTIPDVTIPDVTIPDVTIPERPDTEPSIDLDQICAEISGADVAPLVEEYTASSLVSGTAGVMAGKMCEASLRSQLLAKLGDLGGVLMEYMAGAVSVDESKLSSAFQFNMNEEDLRRLMEAMSTANQESGAGANLRRLGYADREEPSSISIYFTDFAGKEDFLAFLDGYNEEMEAAGKDEQVIRYTDMTGMMMSSVRTIVDSVSYVLIAFVAVSLVVSSIMIGIITYISVMERTREIGVLRAIGASKRNISQVFNAETFIIGCCSGLLGVGITLLILLPGNQILHSLTGEVDITAQLPMTGAAVLVALSIGLTLLGGLIPAKKAAKKDPVIALRTE